MRRPFIYRTHQPAFHHSSPEKRPNQFQQSLVTDSFGNLRHQLVVVHSVKELFQVQVHHPAVACRNILLRFGYCLMRRPPGTKPVAVIGKRPVPSALQDLHYRLLDEAVQHRRDAKLPHPTVRLWYFYALHRLRFVSPAQQLFSDGWPMLFQIAWQLLDGHPVNASATFIALDSGQCLLAVLSPADFFHQLLTTSRAFCLALRRKRLVPSSESLGASLLLTSAKANTSWFFCRLSLISCAAYLPLSLTSSRRTVRAFVPTTRDYYALC
ncbi:hypothetical protein BH20ACI3_BH20ACI3_18820 [soil metagenome]